MNLKLKRIAAVVAGLGVSSVALAASFPSLDQIGEKVKDVVIAEAKKQILPMITGSIPGMDLSILNKNVESLIGGMEDKVENALLGDDWGASIGATSKDFFDRLNNYIGDKTLDMRAGIDKNGNAYAKDANGNKVPIGPDEIQTIGDLKERAQLNLNVSSTGLQVLMATQKVKSIPEALGRIAAMEQGQKVADQALAIEALSIDSFMGWAGRVNLRLRDNESIYTNIGNDSAKFIDPKNENTMYLSQMEKIARYGSPDAKLTGIDGSSASNKRLSTALTAPPLLPLGATYKESEYTEKDEPILRSDKHMTLLAEMLVGVDTATVGNADRISEQPELAVARLKNFARKQLARVSVFQTLDPHVQFTMNEEYVRYATGPDDSDFKDAANKSSQYWLGVIAKQNQGMIMSSIEMRRLQMETNRLLAVLLATTIDNGAGVTQGLEERAAIDNVNK